MIWLVICNQKPELLWEEYLMFCEGHVHSSMNSGWDWSLDLCLFPGWCYQGHNQTLWVCLKIQETRPPDCFQAISNYISFLIVYNTHIGFMMEMWGESLERNVIWRPHWPSSQEAAVIFWEWLKDLIIWGKKFSLWIYPIPNAVSITTNRNPWKRKARNIMCPEYLYYKRENTWVERDLWILETSVGWVKIKLLNN